MADRSVQATNKLAESLSFSCTAVIGGRRVQAVSGKTFETLNPANGSVLANVVEGDAADVDLAVAAARKAFDAGPWPRLAPKERKRLLLRYADVIEAHMDELAILETLESGKPISDTTKIDLPEAITTIRWHAEATDKIYDQLSPSGNGVVSMIVREPIGVVGAVLPWNFPLLMAAWKLGPILATGNTAVIKPAEQTSLSTIRLAELALEAGIPDGVINVVPGYGEKAGRAIGLHSNIDCVTFTGSTEIGRQFLRYSADSNLKRVLLECGGKNPFVVMADADDLDTIAEHATTSIFWNMGENCSSNSRLIVHKKLKEPLLERIIEKARGWIPGDPLDPATRIGPLIEQAHLNKVVSHISKAQEQGASLVHGGHQVKKETKGFFVEPTIFDNVKPSMALAREEVFGPVLAVLEFDKPEAGLALANDTDYGLAASIFTRDIKTAHLAARAVRAGTVTVNCYGEGDITTPFGGYKLSGFGARDKSTAAHDQYCQQKTIWIDLS